VGSLSPSTMSSFSEAFQGHFTYLLQSLEVTLTLLFALRDENILDGDLYQIIQSKTVPGEKVEALLNILVKRPDEEFDVFCEILIKVGQSHIVNKIRPLLSSALQVQEHPERHHDLRVEKATKKKQFLTQKFNYLDVTELLGILEPDYYLPDELCDHEIISDEKKQKLRIRDGSVQYRVLRLLYVVGQKLDSLKDCVFQEALCCAYQEHIANFILNDCKFGDKFHDVRPLNELERRRLNPTGSLMETMDSFQNKKFLENLTREKVLCLEQIEEIECSVSKVKSNRRLLEFMRRRSFADVKNFIKNLQLTRQTSAVKELTESGVFARIITTIETSALMPEDIQNNRRKEISVVESLNALVTFISIGVTLRRPFFRAYEYLCNLLRNGHEIRYVSSENSVAWFIMCRTVESLDSLRASYDKGDLAISLNGIFNCLCDSNDHSQLSLKWTLEDYELCKLFLMQTSGQPFGVFDWKEELEGDSYATQEVVCFHFIIVYSTSTGIFNRTDIST